MASTVPPWPLWGDRLVRLPEEVAPEEWGLPPGVPAIAEAGAKDAQAVGARGEGLKEVVEDWAVVAARLLNGPAARTHPGKVEDWAVVAARLLNGPAARTHPGKVEDWGVVAARLLNGLAARTHPGKVQDSAPAPVRLLLRGVD